MSSRVPERRGSYRRYVRLSLLFCELCYCHHITTLGGTTSARRTHGDSAIKCCDRLSVKMLFTEIASRTTSLRECARDNSRSTPRAVCIRSLCFRNVLRAEIRHAWRARCDRCTQRKHALHGGFAFRVHVRARSIYA